MSNSRSIAAVTATLRRLLATSVASESELADVNVTAQPLDKARDAADTANQLNLFLYLISPNAAWRNRELPTRARPGEAALPPLALNLFYLLSAYGRDNDAEKPFSHLLLGRAMSVLNDHPLLGREELSGALADNDLGDQLERVRITLQPLSIEEVSKIWAGFQMQYRLSVAYEISVVLLDSQQPVRAAAPVLRRGPQGRGFGAGTDPLTAYPAIMSLQPTRPLRPGETLQIRGSGLQVDGTVLAEFVSYRSGELVRAAAMPIANGYEIALPAGNELGAGACSVSLVIPATEPSRPLRKTNSLALQVAPRITDLPKQLHSDPIAAGFSVSIDPAPRPGQTVALLLGSQKIAASAVDHAKLSFRPEKLATGVYLARVRVDGVDSLPVKDPDAEVLEFDPEQMIEVVQ